MTPPTASDEQILALYADGVRISEIVKRLHVGFSRARRVLDAADRVRRPTGPDKVPQPPRRELAARYLELGSIRRVAAHYAVGTHVVYRWLRTEVIPSLPRQPRKSTAERTIPGADQLRQQHHEQRMSVAEMGRHLGASDALVVKWLGYRRIDVLPGDTSRGALGHLTRAKQNAGRSTVASDPAGLLRLVERPHDSALLTRTEVADLLGYSRTSMATVMGRDPGRWPRPAALLRRGRVWVMLWDVDEIVAAAPPATATERRGSVATVSGPDGLLTCAECGRRFRSLGRHLHSAHGIDAAQYRARHQLPATGALHCDGLRQDAAERQLAVLAEDPAAFEHLAPYRTREHLDTIRDAGIEAHRETRTYDVVRAHRAPGQRYAVQVMADRRRARLDEIAQAAGYGSLDEAIAATSELSSRAAGRRIGIGASTVRRRRRAPSPSR